ncbi:MAG: hypothetical protein ACJA2U_001139 [Marinomonas primoryensis]
MEKYIIPKTIKKPDKTLSQKANKKYNLTPIILEKNFKFKKRIVGTVKKPNKVIAVERCVPKDIYKKRTDKK